MQRSPDINYRSSSEESLHGSGNNRKKTAIIITIIAAAVVAASALLFYFLKMSPEKETEKNDFAIVYTKNGSAYLKSSAGACKLDIENSKETVKSADGKKLFYLKKSSYGSGKLDLYCCNLNDAGQAAKGGFIIDYGIEDGFYINDDGSFVIYSKMNSSDSAVESYLYNTGNERSEDITSSIDGVYIFSNENTAYFTKKLGQSTALFKYIFGGVPEQIAADVNNVVQYKSGNVCELLYQVIKTGTRTSDLYSISGGSPPKLVSENISEFLSDEYSAGGNLYYLKASEKTGNWRDGIPDDLEAQDKLMEEPQKSDYLSFFGISFEYNQALAEYREKLDRDALRNSMDSMVTDEKLIPEQFDCYVYKNGSSFKIAEGISDAAVYAVSQTTQPMVIYEKTQYASVEISFSDLAEIMKSSSRQDALTYARQALRKASESKGLFLSCSANIQGAGLNMDDYALKDCKFGFASDGNTLYSFIKDSQGTKSTLYKSAIANGTLSEKEVEDVNITGFSFSGDSLWYIKVDAGMSEGALYKCSSGKSEKIMSSVYSFFCLEDSGVLILRNYSENKNQPSTDLYCFKDANSKLIDDKVAMPSLHYHDSNNIAYIRNITEGSGGELCIFNGSAVKVIDVDSTEIVLF